MNTYLVSYDLQTPGKDYSKLHDHLKNYGNWAKPLESVWLIKSNLEVGKLRDAIRSYTDSNDKLFVVDVTGKAAAWWNMPTDVSTWIKDNL